jgi:D-aspartate ligase
MARRKQTYDLPAVVLGLDELPGIQTARILAERGVTVIGVAHKPNHYSLRTNAIAGRFIICPTEISLLQALVARGKSIDPRRPVLVPCTDDYVAIISRNREVLERYYRIALPDAATVEMLAGKSSFARFAMREGLAVPATYILESSADALEAASKLSYPAVLKPETKTCEWWANTFAKAITVNEPDELVQVYEITHQWAPRLIVQEWVEGGEDNLFSCNCYFGADSRPLATFIARKIRQWPPQTGITSLGEECRNDAVLEESVRLLTRAGYRGLGYVEVKRDARSGKYKIIEVNVGRPTGRSALAETCGVELLMTMYCDLAGLPLPEERIQRYTGGKWIQLVNDCRSAWHYWKKGELTVWQWLRTLKGVRKDAILRFSDPALSLAYLADLARQCISSFGRKTKPL